MKQKLREIKDYVGSADLVIMFNQMRFDPASFGESAFKNEAVVLNQQFD